MGWKQSQPSFGALRRFLIWGLIWSSTISAYGQQQSTSRPEPLSYREREALARPILAEAELVSKDADPTWKALLLYRAAGAWFSLDSAHAILVYREAFDAATEAAPSFRRSIEEAILDDLLPLAPSAVLELLPRAESESQSRLYSAVINFSLFQGDYDATIAAFDGATSGGVLPLGATMNLLASLPQRDTSQGVHVLSAALHYYQSHPDAQGYRWTLALLVARFYSQMPRELVLQAVDAVLARGEEQEKLHPGGGISLTVQGNSIAFRSQYDQQLFAVAPILRELDPERAASLLVGQPEAVEALRKYPEGLRSFFPAGFAPPANFLRVSVLKPQGLMLYDKLEDFHNINPLDMGLEFTVPGNQLGVTGSVVYFGGSDLENSILGSSGKCPPDVLHGLELVRTISNRRTVAGTFARADLIQIIAERCTYYESPDGARAALREQLDLLNEIPEEDRIGYLATAADLYLRLGERDAAADVVQRGFAIARTLYGREFSLPILQKAPSAVWLAAEAYRRMITLGVNASWDATRSAVQEIPDANLRQMEQIMTARALLGVPVRRNLTIHENGTAEITESDITYDQFSDTQF